MPSTRSRPASVGGSRIDDLADERQGAKFSGLRDGPLDQGDFLGRRPATMSLDRGDDLDVR